MASKSKSFSSAFAREPAKMFISAQDAEEATARDQPPEARSTIDDAAPITCSRIKPETKSRRIQLLVRPSTYSSIKAEADELGMSLNELINAILERHAGL